MSVHRTSLFFPLSLCLMQVHNCLTCSFYPLEPNNYEKHALRVSQVIAAVAKVSCKHGLWLVARVNNRGSGFAPLSLNKSHYPINISCSISISLSRIHCFNASNCPAFNASNFFFFSLFSLIPFPFFKASS